MLCSITTFAQEVKYGLKAGVNISNLTGDYPANPDAYTTIEHSSLTGYHIGGFLQYSLSEKLTFQPELLLSNQGNTVETNYDYYDEDFDDREKESFTQTPKLLYLNIPLMLKFEVAKKFHLEVGPQVGFLLSAKSEWEYRDFYDATQNGSVTVDLLNDGTYNFLGETIQVQKGMKRVDFGLNFGASYDITDNFFVQGRYNLGLTSIDEKSQIGQDAKSLNLKNSVLQVSAGYRF